MADHPDSYDDPHRDPDDDEVRHRLRERLESLLPNVIRRTVSHGAGAKQYTEDVIRGAIGEMKLPKEVVATLLDLADNTKKEVVRVAAREFREFLESARFNEELAKILTQLSFEIRTEIRFVPNDQALKPSVTTHAQVRSAGGEAVDAGDETTESINEAVRGHASELVALLLGRVLRGRESHPSGAPEAVASPAPEATGEPAAAPRPGTPRPPRSAATPAAPEASQAEASAAPKRAPRKRSTPRKTTPKA